MFKKTVLLVLVVLCCLAACAPKGDVLRMVVIPADDEISTEERYQPFVDYLEDGIGMKIELMTVVDYAAVVEAMKYNHADIARFGPLNYVQATIEADVEPLVVAYKKGMSEPFFYAYIISRPDLETLEGATFAFVAPGSASGYGVPSVYMKDNGIELGEILFAGSHPAVIEAVKNGSVDAGGIASNRWDTAIEEGVITGAEIKVFAVSDPVPNPLWAVQADMAPELRENLTAAFLSMPEEIAYTLGTNETGYTIAQDSNYDIMRKVLEVLD